MALSWTGLSWATTATAAKIPRKLIRTIILSLSNLNIQVNPVAADTRSELTTNRLEFTEPTLANRLLLFGLLARDSAHSFKGLPVNRDTSNTADRLAIFGNDHRNGHVIARLE